MKNYKIFIWVFMVVIFTSCKETELIINGVKNPKVENAKSIHSFLSSVNCSNEKSAALKFSALSSLIFYGITPTSVYVFDKNGNNLKLPGATNKCSPDPAQFIQRLSRLQEYKLTDGTFNLKDLKNWILFYGDGHLKPDDSVDYFVFVTWAIWSGKKVFSRDVMSCISAAKNNKSAKMDIILINLDMQSEWDAENLKKVRFTKTSMSVLY